MRTGRMMRDRGVHVCLKVSAQSNIELENQIWNRARLTRECSPDGHTSPLARRSSVTHDTQERQEQISASVAPPCAASCR